MWLLNFLGQKVLFLRPWNITWMELWYCNAREISKYKEAFVLLAFFLSVKSSSFEWKFSRQSLYFSVTADAEVMLKGFFFFPLLFWSVWPTNHVRAEEQEQANPRNFQFRTLFGESLWFVFPRQLKLPWYRFKSSRWYVGVVALVCHICYSRTACWGVRRLHVVARARWKPSNWQPVPTAEAGCDS